VEDARLLLLLLLLLLLSTQFRQSPFVVTEWSHYLAVVFYDQRFNTVHTTMRLCV
jgi:hypothetical protein